MAKLSDVTTECPICRAWAKVRDWRILQGAQKVNLTVLKHLREAIDRRIAKLELAGAASQEAKAGATEETREHA